MSVPHVITAGGNRFELPMDIGWVAAHVNNPKNLVPRLIEQINTEKIYDFAFKGARNWTMLDIGANIGLVSAYASDVCDRIIALEPSPLFKVMEGVVGRLPNVTRYELALAGHTGDMYFRLNDVNPTASSAAQTYGQPIMVKCLTLIDLLKATPVQKVDFCKIDIEGSETECLTPYIVDQCKHVIRSYFVEVHNCPNSTWEQKLGRLVQTFAQAGYRRMRIRGDSLFAAYQ